MSEEIRSRILEDLQELYGVEPVAEEDLKAIYELWHEGLDIRINHETGMVFNMVGDYIADVKEWR